MKHNAIGQSVTLIFSQANEHYKLINISIIGQVA